MGIDYMVYVIEKRDDYPEPLKRFLKRVYKETIVLNGKEYWHTFDINAENEEDFAEWYENNRVPYMAGSYFG